MKRILLGLVILLIASYSQAEVRGLTCKPLAEPQQATGTRAQTFRGIEHVVSRHEADIDTRGWELADSVNINSFLPAGEGIEIEFSSMDNQLSITQNYDGLTAEARNALDKAPLWLRAKLETQLVSLEEEYQIFWANVINEVDDPIIDEVAFSIATSSYDYLTSDYAYPELYIQNAEMIYEYDLDLSYVEVIDYGNSLTDANYYTTTRYWSKDANGVIHQTEVPREVYYWHIVHPKITDEIPAFINPDITESNSTHNTNIVAPGEGYFWRDFLYNYADEGYPVLRNYLMQCEYANDYSTGYESAIGACTQWLSQTLQFTSNYERPHQPVRIYRKHIGRCGEHADMRVAIGRIALVPMTSIVCFTVDHTWNEFWDGEWIHWDGGSINNFYMYENGWGSNFGSVIDVRSDGLMTPVTEKYAPNYANLTVYALDGAGKPLDGARVVIGLWLNGQITGDMVGWTDNEGKYEFPIGDGHQYWAAMSTPLGSVDYQLITDNTAGGEEYNVELQISAIMPELSINQIDIPEDDFEDYKLVVEFEADKEIIYGNIVMDDTSEDTWFYECRDNGAVNFFMCDMVHYYSYVSGLPFDAFNTIEESDFGLFSFDMPSPAYGTWHAVIDNSNNIVNPQRIKGSISLYRWEGTGGSATISGNITDASTGEVLENASVCAGAFSTVTDENGDFGLDVYPGTYDIVIDHPYYEAIRYIDEELADGEIFELNAGLSDNPIKPLNITVMGNDETDAAVSWDAPSILLGRSLQGYHVFRMLSEDEQNPENWTELTEDFITETSYTDEQWQTLETGIYRYAVYTEYSEFSSEFAITQEIAFNMTADLSITITTNSGDTPAGAVISLENTEGVNSPYNYEIEYPETGNVQLDVWKGDYEITVTLEHFTGIADSLTITQNTVMDIELQELLTGVSFPGVIDYMLYWDNVPQLREFQSYRVYIDEEEEPFAEVTENYCDLSSLDANEHIAEIEANYSSGISERIDISFTGGSSSGTDQLAYFSFDDDFADSISGWEGSSETVQLSESPFGNAPQFNGADYITIPANPELTESALHYTTLFWVYGTEENTGWRGLLGRPGRNQCAWINGDSGYVHHRYHTEVGGTNDGAANTPNSSFDWLEWQQVAIVNDGYTSKTYINGELLAETSLTSALIADSTDMYIGKSPDSATATGYYFGQIDEVRIWNRGLSSAEIQDLYLTDAEVLGTGLIHGHVTNLETGDPLQGVQIQSGIFESITDELGYYELELFPGFHDLHVSLEEYLVMDFFEIELEASEDLEYDIEYELTDSDENELIIPAGELISYPNPYYATENRSGITFIYNNSVNTNAANMQIYNLKGQKTVDFDVVLQPGRNIIHWNGNDNSNMQCGSGIYFYRLSGHEISSSGKLIIIR